MSKFEIKNRVDGEYYFNLKARNGEIILTSEGYTTKANCKKGIESVMENSKYEERFDKLTSKDGQFYFVLKAANGEIIGTSEMYTTESGRKKGINSVMNNAPVATVADLTGE